MSKYKPMQKYVIGHPNDYIKEQYIHSPDEDQGKYAGMVLVMENNDDQVDKAIADGYIPVDTATYEDFFLDKKRLNSETKEFYSYTKPAVWIAEEKLAATKSGLINSVQTMLDAKAQEKGYDNGVSCASYASSTNTTFAAEAAKYVAWRDNVWSTCYAILAKAEAGEKYIDTWADAVPTEAELLAALPVLNW